MDKKIRLGIIGVGNMGNNHADRIYKGNCPDLELVTTSRRKTNVKEVRADTAGSFAGTK